MQTITINESQRSILTEALRLAEEKYKENAQYLRHELPEGLLTNKAVQCLADQFISQGKAANVMRGLVENADSVIVVQTQAAATAE